MPLMTDDSRPVNAPPGFHLLAKPSGSTCNIDCTYCFFLSKEALYPNEKNRTSEATLEAYIRQLLEAHRTPTVTVAWQGGEPTLMKVEFFRRSIELVEKYRRPEQSVQHTFQTATGCCQGGQRGSGSQTEDRSEPWRFGRQVSQARKSWQSDFPGGQNLVRRGVLVSPIE